MPKNTPNKNFLVRIFEWLSASINGGERAIIDLASAVVPYMVPIIPAYLMYDHAMNHMGFEPWIAKTAGVVVELLGLASVSTAVRFFLYNRRFKKDAKNENPNKAPFKQAMAIYASYVVIVYSAMYRTFRIVAHVQKASASQRGKAVLPVFIIRVVLQDAFDRFNLVLEFFFG